MKMPTSQRCHNCGKELEEGMNTLKLVEGVMGNDGLVEIGEAKLFCRETCFEEYCRDPRRRLPQMRKRIP